MDTGKIGGWAVKSGHGFISISRYLMRKLFFLGHLSQYAIPVCQHIFVFTCRLALQDQKISFFTINLSFGAALKQGEAPLYPRAEDLLRV
jgi:hypothetical protein